MTQKMPQSGRSEGRHTKKAATACMDVENHSNISQAHDASKFQQSKRSTAATHGIYTVPNRGATSPAMVHCHLHAVNVAHMLGPDVQAANLSEEHYPRGADARTPSRGCV